MAISGKYAPKGATQKVKVKKNAGDNPKAKGGKAVSYTHLTLPTIYSV